MSILVTGGTGFIGSYLVRALLERGERVVAFDTTPNTELVRGESPQITFVRGDVSQITDILHTVKKEGVKEIHHLGALLVPACEADPVKALTVNVRGTVDVLEAARLMDVEKVVFTSSVGVFGPDLPEPVTDDAPKNPPTDYGMTKLLCELYGL